MGRGCGRCTACRCGRSAAGRACGPEWHAGRAHRDRLCAAGVRASGPPCGPFGSACATRSPAGVRRRCSPRPGDARPGGGKVPPSKPTVPPEGPVPETSVASDPAIAPSPSPSQQPRLRLDTPALRRAIREIAGTSSPAQRAARPERQPDAPDDAASPLASGMSAAAHGDCLKGDFKGSGMGLLSLPMLALAAAQGRCAGR